MIDQFGERTFQAGGEIPSCVIACESACNCRVRVGVWHNMLYGAGPWTGVV